MKAGSTRALNILRLSFITVTLIIVAVSSSIGYIVHEKGCASNLKSRDLQIVVVANRQHRFA